MPQAATTVSVAVTASAERRDVVAAPLHLGGIDFHRRRQHLLQRFVGHRVGLAALERVTRGRAEIVRQPAGAAGFRARLAGALGRLYAFSPASRLRP